MTTLNRPNSALLVIDVQNDVVAEAYKRDSVVERIQSAVEKARAKGTPVIWVQHSDDYLAIDSLGWQIVPELEPLPNEPVVRKLYCSSFEATNLDDLLENADIGHLFIAGAETNHCVRHTSHAALERGYDITLLSDAHTTSDGEGAHGDILARQIVDEQNQGFDGYALPGRGASVSKVAESAL
jgi:nicotinamidase-related amidase